jgi:hypothetical protein
MAKQSTATNKPNAVETIMSLAETAMQFHKDERPTLASVARTCGRASRLLRISDLDERMSCENQATIALAKKLNLVG